MYGILQKKVLAIPSLFSSRHFRYRKQMFQLNEDVSILLSSSASSHPYMLWCLYNLFIIRIIFYYAQIFYYSFIFMSLVSSIRILFIWDAKTVWYFNSGSHPIETRNLHVINRRMPPLMTMKRKKKSPALKLT